MTSPVNPFVNTAMGETIQKWLESTGFAPKEKPAPEPTIFDNPFTQAMQLMFGMQKPEAERTVTNPFFDNPFAKAFQEMMGSLGNPVEPKPTEAPKEQAKAEMESYMNMLNNMFDSGLDVQKNYQKSLETIFETYMPKTPTSAPPKA